MNRTGMEAALAAARAPRSCRHCGRLLVGSAFAVHRDDGRCLPDHTLESLCELRDGAWFLRGSEAGGR